MRSDEKKARIFELADTIFQSWWTVVAGVCVGLTAVAIVLSMIQPWFEATALIYVTPELTRELTRSTVSEDMTRRMVALQEAVLGSEYVRRMIDEHYGRPASEEEVQEAIRSVRRRTLIEPAAVSGSRGQETLYSFRLIYRDTTGERAADGANQLAELFIEQNKEFRAGQAREALRAAEDQAGRARRDYDAVQQKLIEFRAEHRFETDEHQHANLTLFQQRQDDLDGVLTGKREAVIRLQELKRQLPQAEAGAAVAAEEVAMLRRQLDELLVQYSEAHPSVKRVRRQLRDALDELGVASERVEDPSMNLDEYPSDPRVTSLRAEIETAERQIGQLEIREGKLRDEIVEYERRIDAVAIVQPQLSRLLAENDMQRERYEQAQMQADRARESLFLEETLSGERFELAEAAQIPLSPVFPQPMRFYVMGILVGCMLFIGPLVARRFLSPLISSEAGLLALTDVPLMVTIPRITTASTRGLVVRRTVKNFALSALFAGMTVATFVVLGGS